ncbi:hypothetical protein C8R45DRAFT_991877 [Mycena sanguinolenta]|nr:hypothetical protein C8R45DRAFT_991877 [Mycena sanguinolenta]
MQAAPITLFDLDSKLETSFSPRVWATRLLLNYKQIKHKTTWIHFSELGAVLEAARVPPTRTTAPKYTVPVIIDGENIVADSRAIAEYIERTYLERTVPILAADHQKAIETTAAVLRPLVIPNVVTHLEGRDAVYFRESRQAIFGKELSEICPASQRDEMIGAFEVALAGLSDFVGEANDQGWVFGKDGPAYEDFELVGWFIWAKVAGLPDLWERIKELNDAKWSKLLSAVEPYMSVH